MTLFELFLLYKLYFILCKNLNKIRINLNISYISELFKWIYIYEIFLYALI
jgi:hypothetical protein